MNTARAPSEQTDREQSDALKRILLLSRDTCTINASALMAVRATARPAENRQEPAKTNPM
jgi:hypothetical protein